MPIYKIRFRNQKNLQTTWSIWAEILLEVQHMTFPSEQKQTGKCLNTDIIDVNICQKLGVELTGNDISRSNPIKNQTVEEPSKSILNLKTGKSKHKIYSEKRKLKNSSVFVTEDLTQFRQGLVQKISKAIRDGFVNSFWTNDGRIFAKSSRKDQKNCDPLLQ